MWRRRSSDRHPSTARTPGRRVGWFAGVGAAVAVSVVAGGGVAGLRSEASDTATAAVVPEAREAAASAARAARPDEWLFMGDSITVLGLYDGVDDLVAKVRAIDPDRNPLIVPAGVGGATTGSAHGVIDGLLAGFGGQYVVLGYGTNDYPPDFDMERLVDIVLAAGKTPVVPTLPWSDWGTNELARKYERILDLYRSRPEIVRGPDFWNAFRGRTDLIPSGDVHPNEAGIDLWRSLWAEVITGVPPDGPPPPSPVIDAIDGPASVRAVARRLSVPD